MDNLDFENLREGSKLEAKLARGGLPHSLWESYSAFANTEGGTILLGVAEDKDHNLIPRGLDNPEKLLDDFWNDIHNARLISANILMDDDVRIVDIDGAAIICIDVPRADRHVQPVFINNNPLTGTYRRNRSGDYHCDYEQVQAMMRDAAVQGQDARAIEEVGLDELDRETIRRYRNIYDQAHDRHPWSGIEDEAFLCKIGAAGRGADGNVHPTGAGLLLFGQDWVITREYPHYFLDYRRQTDSSTRWNDRFVSSEGDWSGNLIDFYDRAYNKLKQALETPFRLEGIRRVDDTPAHRALREALANCITNADFYGRQGVVCLWEPDAIRIFNPGLFRIEVDAAIAGGITDPRNDVIMRILSYIDIGERAGSGLPKVFEGWQESGYRRPRIEQSFEPERTTLVLPLEKAEPSESDVRLVEVDNKVDDKSTRVDNKVDNTIANVDSKADNTTLEVDNATVALTRGQRDVIALMSRNPTITQMELATELGVSRTTISKRIAALQSRGAVVREGSRKAGRWKVTLSDKTVLPEDGE